MCAVTKVAKLSSWSLPQTINWHEHVHYKKKLVCKVRIGIIYIYYIDKGKKNTEFN